MSETGAARTMPEIEVPTALTFAALVAGLVLGTLLAGTGAGEAALAIAGPVGSLWLSGLKMTIVPLVSGLLFLGVVDMVAAARAGRMAQRTLGWIAAMVVVSAAIGLVGMPALLALFPPPAGADGILASGSPGETGAVPTLADFLAQLVPDNVIAAAAGGSMLPLLVFIVLLAVATTRLSEDYRKALTKFFAAIAAAMIVVIGWVLWLAPLGVFALGFGLAANVGAEAFGTLGHYILLVSALGLAVMLAAYALGLWQGGAGFLRAILPSQAVALSTQSSLASLPAMLASARTLGVGEQTSEFVFPLAVTIFRATSAAMNIGVVLYVAHLAGVEVPLPAMLAGGAVAILVSMGSVSLPGTASFVASTAPIALTMGVPIEPLAILVAVEMLPDVMRTVGNVTANVAVAAAVDGE